MTNAGVDGLQAERTVLAWSRTSLGALVNGVLLILIHASHNGGRLQLVSALLAGLLAVVIYLIGFRRQRTLAKRPLPARITAEMEVQVVGLAVIALIVITALGLFV